MRQPADFEDEVVEVANGNWRDDRDGFGGCSGVWADGMRSLILVGVGVVGTPVVYSPVLPPMRRTSVDESRWKMPMSEVFVGAKKSGCPSWADS